MDQAQGLATVTTLRTAPKADQLRVSVESPVARILEINRWARETGTLTPDLAALRRNDLSLALKVPGINGCVAELARRVQLSRGRVSHLVSSRLGECA
jgi:hypothetical protein